MPCLSPHLQYLHVLLFGDRHILPILTALFYFKNVLSESLARVAHDAYTDPIFKELRCLKFDAIYLSQLGMFKYSNKLLPQTFDNIFLRINTRKGGEYKYLHVQLDCANFLQTIKPYYFTILLVQTFVEHK
jgi:hypothetical protein